MSDAWGDLDKYAKEDTSKPAEPAKTPEPPKAAEKPPEPTKTPEPPKPPEKTPEPPKPPEPSGKAKKPADFLREKLASVEKERNEFRSEIERLKASIAKPAEDPEKKSLMERLESESKRRSELEQEMKYAAYERSQEFKEKYQQPYVDAFNAAQKKVASFKIVERKNDVDEVIQAARQATPEDFSRLVLLPDAEAAEAARQLFGDAAANLVLWHREKVIDLATTQQNAIEAFRKHGSEREKQFSELQSKQQKELSDTFDRLNKAAADKYPQWFKPIEGDNEGNELLQKGYDEADMAFGENKLPPNELVRLHSRIRNKAAAFGRMAYLNKGLKARIAELEAELAEYTKSSPTGGEGTPSKSAEGRGKVDSIDDALDGLDKYAKEPLT